MGRCLVNIKWIVVGKVRKGKEKNKYKFNGLVFPFLKILNVIREGTVSNNPDKFAWKLLLIN